MSLTLIRRVSESPSVKGGQFPKGLEAKDVADQWSELVQIYSLNQTHPLPSAKYTEMNLIVGKIEPSLMAPPPGSISAAPLQL